MTLIDIKNALLTHFISSSTFSFPDDLSSIKVDKKEDGGVFVDRKEDIVRVAINGLVKVGILEEAKPDLYVLTGPLTQLNQNVMIGPMTAMMVGDLVNDWMRHTGEIKDTGYVVNKLAITDRDIAAVCHICYQILANDGEDLDDEEETKK